MGNHERAWSGLTILIFGDTPLLPMRIEQMIAQSSPQNELRVESFENYDDALEFCENSKNVGFALISETCGNLPPASVLTNFLAAYENSSNLPAFGALIDEGEKSVRGYKILNDSDKFIDYVSASDFTTIQATSAQMDRLWEKFSTAFEAQFIPGALQSTMIAVAGAAGLSTNSISFQWRALNALTANLNVSWLEMTALRWVNIVEHVDAHCPEVLLPHYGLRSLVKSVASTAAENLSLADIAALNAPLPVRITQILKVLDSMRLKGTLKVELDLFATSARPGASAIIRHLAKIKNNLISMAEESSQGTDRLYREVG